MSGFPHPVPSGRVTCPIGGPPRLDVDLETRPVPGKKQVGCSGGWDRALQVELNRLYPRFRQTAWHMAPACHVGVAMGQYDAATNRGGGNSLARDHRGGEGPHGRMSLVRTDRRLQPLA